MLLAAKYQISDTHHQISDLRMADSGEDQRNMGKFVTLAHYLLSYEHKEYSMEFQPGIMACNSKFRGENDHEQA